MLSRFRELSGNEKRGISREAHGFTIIEVLVAVGLLSIIAVGFITALNTVSKGRFVRDQWETAKNLAESQMEYVKQLGFAVSYTPAPVPADYPGYLVSIAADNITSRDGNLQKIRVLVSYQGKALIISDNATLVGYKVKR